MPNPIMSLPFNRSKTNVNRRTAITPAVEEYEGDNLPYRGVVDHGVSSDIEHRDTAEDMPDPDGRLVPLYEVDDNVPDPIPVYITNQSSRERRSFRTIRAYARGTTKGTAGAMILSQDDSRTRATIRNKSIGAGVWLGDSPETANSSAGYFLGQDESYVTESQDAIYATVDTADDLGLNIAVEYRIPIDG